MNSGMANIGTKRTLSMPRSMSAFGVKRTCGAIAELGPVRLNSLGYAGLLCITGENLFCSSTPSATFCEQTIVLARIFWTASNSAPITAPIAKREWFN